MNKKELILDNVKDLVSSFLYYDRKELELGDIEKAIRNDEILLDDIIKTFVNSLAEGIRPPRTQSCLQLPEQTKLKEVRIHIMVEV